MGNDMTKKKTTEIELSKSKESKKDQKKMKPKRKKPVGKIVTKRSACWKCGFVTLILLFITNVVIASVLWFTTLYEDSIHQLVSFHEGGYIFKLWANPPVPRMLSVYPFNYTNSEAVVRGLEVPNVQELGPYVFREKMSRVNVKFNGNGTLTYQENRTQEFVPELSKGSLSDVITVPNFPLLAAHHLEGSSLFEYSGVSFLKMATFSEEFHKITVDEIIWGYDDRFSLISRTLKNVLKPSASLKQFGILSWRKGLNKDKITIGTGVEEPDKLSLITRYDGREMIGAWNDPECDKIQGNDGTIFPRTTIEKRQPIYVYTKEMCRKMPLYYEMDVTTKDGIPALRYKLEPSAFQSPDKNPSNKCYCKNSVCPPYGITNAAPCNARAPVMMSFPHFTHADPSLRAKVTGLTPDSEKYESVMDIHPIGIPLNGVGRVQANLFINKSANTPWLNLKDGTVLPLAWTEIRMGELTDFLKSLVYHLSFTVVMINSVLSYSSLCVIVISPILMSIMLKYGKYREVTLYS